MIVRSYVNQKKTRFLFIFDVKRNNLGSSTFISFECKLLIITFKIWWSFPRSSKEKDTWHGKKCVLVAWLKKFISILMILFLPFWCYISLFLVNKIFIFINYWCLFCPLDDVQHEKFFLQKKWNKQTWLAYHYNQIYRISKMIEHFWSIMKNRTNLKKILFGMINKNVQLQNQSEIIKYQLAFIV